MADQPKKGTVQFNRPPEDVLQRELTPEQQAAKERMLRMKNRGLPKGGAPEVKIPPLSAQPIEGGGTMAQQAEILRDPASPLSPSYNPELALMAQQGEQPLTPDQMAAMASGQPGVPRMGPGGQVQQGQPAGGPFAVLPPQAQQSPGFRPGVGSMYAGNQPGLKAPVHTAPNADGYKPALSDETRKSMEALAAMQGVVDQKTAAAKREVEDQANPPKEPLDDETDMQRELREMLNNEYQWNLLNNPDRRKKIEGRLEPMNITDVILHGEVRQDVPIDPKKLVITYRSVTGEEDLAVKRMMFGEEGGDRYMLDKFTLMQLTLAMVAINGEPLPTHLKDGKFDETKFLEKFDKVLKFPIQFLADLGIQYMWFDERVRDLFVGSTEALKNG
jgi:hypothetical protein